MRLLCSLAALGVLSACGDGSPAPAPSAPVRGKPLKAPPEVALLTGVQPPAPAAAPVEEAPRIVDGYREVKFELLTGYDYEWSPTTGKTPGADQSESIPAAVRALDGTKVSIVGYMTPIDFDKDGVKSFLLTNYPGGCCFGMVPRLNEWVEVELEGERRVEYSYFDPIVMRGVLQVGEARSGEVVTSLYRMQPDDVKLESEQ